MRRLYSTFPDSWPGLGLLLLRSAVGATLIIQGLACLPELQDLKIATWAVCLLSLASGSSLLIGFLTPIAGALAVVAGLSATLLDFPTANEHFFCGNPLSLDLIIMAVVSALLGPGAFSLDARLFGRRKIIIPRPSPSRAPGTSPSQARVASPSQAPKSPSPSTE